MRFRCEAIERRILPSVQGDRENPSAPGQLGSPMELVAVVLKPAPTREPGSPNGRVWTHGVAIGELRLDGLERAWVDAHFTLNREYHVEVTEASEDPTRKI